MATRFGDTVNPALGATNYAPFLQGSLAGSAAMGQGIANLGEGAGKFLGDISEAKKKRSGALAFLKSAKGLVDDPNRQAVIDEMIMGIETAPLAQAAAMGDQAKSAVQFLGDQMDREIAQQDMQFAQGMQTAELYRGLNSDLFAREEAEKRLDLLGRGIEVDRTKAATDESYRKFLEEQGRAEIDALRNAPAPLTEAQKKLNEAAGTDAAKWISGERAETEDTIARLQEILDTARIQKVNTGPVVGTLAKIPGIKSLSTEKNALKSDLESIAMKGLRATLGSQFTEKEGERLVRGLYDQTLQSGQNEEKVRNFIQTLRAKADERQRVADDIFTSGQVQGGTIQGSAPAGTGAAAPAEEKESAWLREWLKKKVTPADGPQGAVGPPGARGDYTVHSGFSSTAGRSAINKAGGISVLLDSNKADGVEVTSPLVVIPDGASKATRAAAQKYVDGMVALQSKMGRNLKGRVVTRSQNGRGRSNAIHTEGFAVTDRKMTQYLQTPEGAKNYADLLKGTFGTIPGANFFLPHGPKDPGAINDATGLSEVGLAGAILSYLK